MANKNIHLQGDLTGIVYSEPFKKEGDGEVNIVYEQNRCTAAWLEYAEQNGVTRKVPILPNKGQSIHSVIPDKSECRIVVCMGRTGDFRALLDY